jgi:hypothetical protein
MSRLDHLREQIDACRPGSRDLAAPELAELSQALKSDAHVAEEFSRAQAWDRTLVSALADVPVPPGLADRLLAAAADASPSEPPRADALEAAAKSTKRRRLRVSRWQLLAGTSLALTLALCVAIYQSVQPAKIVTQQELSGAVESWLSQVQPAAWTPLQRGNYPRGIAPDTAVPAMPQGSQQIRFNSPAGWSANVTALNLAPAGRLKAPQAVLFVVRSSARFIVPPNPASTKRLDLSRGIKAVAWQRMNSPWLYVLAVEEAGGQKLNDYLQATHYTVHEPQRADEPL